MNNVLRVRLLLICTLSAFFASACQAHPLEEAKNKVQVGMLRDDAVSILGQKAWYYQPCPNRGSVDDLFFYGSHKYDSADIVILNSFPDQGIYHVTGLGTFTEPNAWHAAYRDCLDENRFEK